MFFLLKIVIYFKKNVLCRIIILKRDFYRFFSLKMFRQNIGILKKNLQFDGKFKKCLPLDKSFDTPILYI